MNPLIAISIGVGLISWGFKQIARNPEKPLTILDRGGKKTVQATTMPKGENEQEATSTDSGDDTVDDSCGSDHPAP